MNEGILRRRTNEKNYVLVTISQYKYTTFYYNKALIIPKGVEVTYVLGGYYINNQNYSVIKHLDGNVIPQEFGVVLHGNPGTYKFYFASKEQTRIANSTVGENGVNGGNILEGVLTRTQISPQEGKRTWFLTIKNNAAEWQYITESSWLPANRCFYRTDYSGGGGGTAVESIFAFIYRPNKTCSIKVLTSTITENSTKNEIFGNEDYSNVLIDLLVSKENISSNDKFKNILNLSNIFIDGTTDWFELTDGIGIYIPSYFKHANALSYSRQNVSTYNDVCLPVSIPQMLGQTFFGVNSIIYRLSGYDTQPIFDDSYGKEIPAGEPIIVKVDGIQNININKVKGDYKINRNSKTLIQYNNDNYSIKFKGTFNTISSKPIQDYNYYKVKSDSLGFTDLSFPLSSFRSYIETKDNLTEYEPQPYIYFKDPLVKQICVNNYDTNEDGEIQYSEAANATSLVSFQGQNIESFDELKYFTQLTFIPSNCFKNCSNLKSIQIPKYINQINAGSFAGCSNLTSIFIPKNLTKITTGGALDFTFSNTPINRVDIEDLEAWFKIKFDGYRQLNPLTKGADLYLNGIEIKYITVPDSITELKFAVLAGSNIESIDFNNVTTINSTCFRGCKLLKKLIFPDSVILTGNETDLACQCTDLEYVKLPKNVLSTKIAYSMFDGCTNLKELVFSPYINYIDGNAFNRCTNIEKIYIYDTDNLNGLSQWLNIDYYTTSGSSIIGQNPLALSGKAYLYYNGNKVTDLIIPSDISVIKNLTFGNTGKFNSVTIPNTVTEIQNALNSYNFINTDILNINMSTVVVYSNPITLNFGDNVETISNIKFQDDTNLENLTIGANVHTITDYIFNRSKLKNITVSQSNLVFDSRNNCNAIIQKIENSTDGILIQGSINTVIPNNITTIGSNAFRNINIVEINIPDNITEIGSHAFYNCQELKKAILGEGVQSIKGYAFYLCPKLEKLIIYATTPPDIEEYIIIQDDEEHYRPYPILGACYIYVKPECVEAYKTDEQWSEYEQLIRSISDLDDSSSDSDSI